MSKRANGEGSIYRRPDGRWCASLSIGRGKRAHFLGKNRAEVGRKLTSALKDRDDGLPVVVEHPSVEQFLRDWLNAVRSTVRERTYDRYEQYVRLHIIPVLGRTKLARVTPQQLSGLYAERLATGLAPTTVHHLHATIHKALIRR